MRTLFFVLLLLLSGMVNAKNELSTACKPFAIKEASAVLKAKTPTLFMIHNISNSDVWLTHTTRLGGSSTELLPDKWSAIVVSEESYAFNCVESRPGHEQQFPCASLVAVVKCPNAKIAHKTNGTSWVAENKNLKSVMANAEITT